MDGCCSRSGLQLRNGRLVVPVWFSDGSAHDMGPAHRGHRPSCVGVIYSDDSGETWCRGELAARSGGILRNPSETALVELSDGSVLFNIRSESDAQRRLISVSPDGAAAWTPPRFDSALLDPVCMGSLLRISWPESGRNQIVFPNPDTLDRTMESCWGGRIQAPNCDRKQLTIQLSLDDCRSWNCKRFIESGPAGYSDLALDRQGRILCFYECGILSGMFDDRYLALARFDLEWLTAGKIAAGSA